MTHDFKAAYEKVKKLSNPDNEAVGIDTTEALRIMSEVQDGKLAIVDNGDQYRPMIDILEDVMIHPMMFNGVPRDAYGDGWNAAIMHIMNMMNERISAAPKVGV